MEIIGREKDELIAIKDKLAAVVKNKQDWQAKKRKLYDGDWDAESLNISLNEDIDSRIPAKLDWCSTAVDHVSDQLIFDVVRGDGWGINKLLQSANCDTVFESAIRQSLISACSFVSVTKGVAEAGEPPVVLTAYTGDGATGVYNDRTNRLEAGIAIIGYTLLPVVTPKDFRIFLPGGIYDVIDKRVFKVSDGIGVVQLVPFVYKQDLASKPFGESRLSSAATDVLERALRTYKRMELSSETYSNPQRWISVINAASDDTMSSDDFSKLVEMGKYLVFEGNAESFNTGEFTANGPANLKSFLESIIGQFASAMSMEPSEFGLEAANGGQSSETIVERKRKMGALLDRTKRSYGESIKLISLIAYLITNPTKTTVPEEFGDVVVRWKRSVSVSDYGALGDAIGKIQEVSPETRNSDFVLDVLGISMRGLSGVESSTVTGTDAGVQLATRRGVTDSEAIVDNDRLVVEGNPGR